MESPQKGIHQMKKAYGAALFSDKGLLIVQRQKNEDFYPNYWELPGGGAEKDETWEESLRRELREEIGVSEFSIHEKYYNFSYGNTFEEHYIAQVNKSPNIILNPAEHSDFMWIKEESELDGLLISDNLRESVSMALKKVRG